MSNAFSVAVTGMRAATVRLEASARNVAKAGTRGVSPSTAANGTPVYLLTQVDQSSVPPPTGGVVASVRAVAPVWMAAAESEPAPEPDVDLGAEAQEQAGARTSFLANAKTLEVAQEMVKRLFELED